MCIERNMPKLYSILEGELERVFDDIFANPEQIKYKGEKAWDRIKRMHDPDEYAKCIEAVMEE
jgi:hypothetical protein